jgi:hypothetical protein
MNLLLSFFGDSFLGISRRLQAYLGTSPTSRRESGLDFTVHASVYGKVFFLSQGLSLLLLLLLLLLP